MKRVMINAYQVGLVFKNGVYEKMLNEGVYWFWDKDVLVYNKTDRFISSIELSILLKDESLANALTVVEVTNNEIALKYVDGFLKEVLTEGKYAFWKGLVNYKFIKANIGNIEIGETIDRTTLQSKWLAQYVRTSTVENYEKAIMLVDGKYFKTLNAGMYFWWKNNIIINVAKVDTRMQQVEINGQEILTKDKATLRINAFAQYQVVDVEKAILSNKEYDKQLYVMLQLAIREFVGKYSFDELLENKDAIGSLVIDNLIIKATTLGVEVLSIGIRDIVLPGDVKEIMNQVLVAEKKAQANTIMRREETASTRSLLNTAKLMEDNAMLWKLKEMEYVEKIADKISNISVNGNGDLVSQLKQIFVTKN